MPPNYHPELYAGQNKPKIAEDLSNSKNMVFNVKKLLNDGESLMLWRRGRKKQTQLNEYKILLI